MLSCAGKPDLRTVMKLARYPNLKIVLMLVAMLSPFAGISAMRFYCGEARYRFSDNQVFVLTDQWAEFTPRRSICCDEPYQEVYLTVMTPFQETRDCKDCCDIRLGDGTTPEIECELVGADGSVYPCRFNGIVSDGTSLYLTFAEQGRQSNAPRSRIYSGVRLSSNRPLLCAEAKLHCWHPSDSE